MANDPNQGGLVQSILHATDLSEVSRPAFAYALALSLLRQTKLTLLYVGEEHRSADGWAKFPQVRETLEKWGLLEPGSPKTAVFDKFGVRVKKVGIKRRDPASAIVRYLESNPSDMLVLSTRAREGLPRWVERSVAETTAERSSTMTLFVPDGSRGFISSETGHLSLRSILVPVARDTDSRAAITFATRAAHLLRAEEDVPVKITLLHVGPDRPVLPESISNTPHCDFQLECRDGDVVDEIIAAADRTKAELIVMTTLGRSSVIDAMKGSTTQQVLRRSPCALLAVPTSD
jgi:nucleotide-binding universal stress UspA family protein